jgi:alkyl sulfatase BDS1-like metallo-beta-lactamase superfamily hydrolase
VSEPLWRSRPDAFSMLPATSVRQKQIADGIFLSEGYSNAFLVTTAGGRVVINAGLGFEAPIHKRYFDSVDASPVRYVVLTQGHVDHVGGVDHFRERGTLVVAQANNAEHQAYDARLAPFRQRRSSFAFAQAFRGMQGAAGAPPPKQSQPKPDVLFRERFHFTLGGVDFELVACNGAETRDSLVAWLPERRVLFAGNVFGALFGHFPNLVTIRGDRYRDALEYVATLELLLGFDAELLCVGHHDPVVGRDTIRAEIVRMRDATLFVHDEIVRRMNAGGDVWSALREIRLPARLEVGEGYGKVAWSARAIWEQYQGWFHGRSTTELYDTPYWAVSPQLVALAGGPDAVAEAALKKAESAPLEALHLAEAALAADAQHAGALRASVAAHRTLLRGTANFWETRWLEQQIAQLEAKLGGAE